MQPQYFWKYFREGSIFENKIGEGSIFENKIENLVMNKKKP